MADEKSLSHTKWKCQYHIVMVPKFRRKIVYGKLRADLGEILRRLCDYKGVEIIEAQACIDHIHMLVSIPPKVSRIGFHGVFKGKKHTDDIRAACKPEVQVRQQEILGERLLRKYSRNQ